jgi:hypothetical protein
MDPRRIESQSTPANSRIPSLARRSGVQQSPLFLAIAGLVEVVVACVMVVGIFAAASQPFGWSSVLQFGACGVIGGLLWYADRTMIVARSPVSECDIAHRAPVCR